jgi:hypothetical protein
MKVFTINETTNIRENNWVNNGFFNNIYIRVYGKNKYLGTLIKVVDDFWKAEDAKKNPISKVGDRLASVTKDPVVKESVQQVSDSINQVGKSNVQGRKYYKWYLIELAEGLSTFSQYKRMYVREDVVKLVR